jgi:hypothetical protein
VAEPWSSDFAALAERSREQLSSLAATRASLSTRSQETKMRFFIKSHPVFAALAAVAVLTLAGGAAYAVVREVFVSIDPDKPAPEIEHDIHSQLEAAGVPSTVHVDKDDGRLKVRIGTTDPAVGSDVQIHVNGVPSTSRELRFELALACQLDDAQRAALEAAASSEAMLAVIVDRGDKSDADVIAAVQAVFRDAGFEEVDVKIADGTLRATIKAPPVAK